MFLNKLNPLPEWNRRRRFLNMEEGESWKWKTELEIAERLYNQWRHVFELVMAFAENLPTDEDDVLSPRSMIYQNAYIIAPKIMSASGDTLYQIKMENAALIRFNCRQMWEQVAMEVIDGHADPAHKKVIEDELDTFKAIFREWVATFQRDDMQDEWGLF